MTNSAHAPIQESAELDIHTRPPSPRRLSRKVLMTSAVILGGIVAAALLLGFSEHPRRHGAAADQNLAAVSGPPESVREAPGQYEVTDLPRADLAAPHDMLWGDHGAPQANAQIAPPQNPAWSGANASAGGSNASGGAPQPDAAIARSSPIFFGGGGGRSNAGATMQSGGAATPSSRAGFLASQRGDDGQLDARLTPPRSRYELIAGAIIPAALVTELNSDLPGRAIAQVTANVYDSVSGEHLLVPQGARLIGTYDSENGYGDQRLLLVWNRLIFPNGWSISLRGMDGADPSGAAGLSDITDNHLWRLGGAVGLSAIISVIANNAESDHRRESLSQNLGDAAAQEAARTGGRIIDRELAVRPTLRIRAGGAVRVLVTKDIELRPYPER